MSVFRLDLATLEIYSFSGPVGQAQPNLAENIFELSLHYQKQNHKTRADIKKMYTPVPLKFLTKFMVLYSKLLLWPFNKLCLEL